MGAPSLSPCPREIFTRPSTMMYVVLFAVASIAAAVPSSRIINGEAVPDTSVAPWTVSLQKSGSHFCGGSVIASKYVMSACHCKQSTGATVAMGSIEWQNPKFTSHGMFECHPDWNSNIMDYDFSIITLSNPVDVNDPDVQAIPIAMKDYPANTPALITGWGRVIYQSSFHPNTLQMATTNLVSKQRCMLSWGPRITDRMQCVGGNGLNSACKGDSGGPLAVQDSDDGIWYLVGNTSWGPSGCDEDTPGAFSKNFAVYDWINSTISQ